jgi:hypothetical protein
MGHAQARLQLADCQALAPSPYQEPDDLEPDGIAKFGETASSGFDVHASNIARSKGHYYNYKTGSIVYADWYQPRVLRTIRTTDNITGTSASTPTIVANAAPDLAVAAAIALFGF